MYKVMASLAVLMLAGACTNIYIHDGADAEGGLMTSAVQYGPEARQRMADEHCARYGKRAHFVGHTDNLTRMFRCQ
jgi:hypothetical protein